MGPRLTRSTHMRYGGGMDENLQHEMIEYATALAWDDYSLQASLKSRRQDYNVPLRTLANLLEWTEEEVRDVETGDPTLSQIRRYSIALEFHDRLP